MKVLSLLGELAPFLIVAFGFAFVIRAIINADRRERADLADQDRRAAQGPTEDAKDQPTPSSPLQESRGVTKPDS